MPNKPSSPVTSYNAGAILRALGLDPRRVRSLKLTIDAGKLALLEVEKFVYERDVDNLTTVIGRYDLVERVDHLGEEETPDEAPAVGD